MSRLSHIIERAAAALVDRQHRDGFWAGELEGDSILASEYILLRFMLGQDDDPQLPLIGNHLRKLQQPTGGWSLYPGGPADLSATVKGYFALKLLGDSADLPSMRAAREIVLAQGGAQRSNSFSKFYLAGLGQVSYSDCPVVPPEIIFLPRWAYFNLYAVSAWTRTMILPLAITTTLHPLRRIPPERGIGELFCRDAQHAAGGAIQPHGWRKAFIKIDKILKAYARLPFHPFRRMAMRRVERWLLEHLEDSDGLGAIFPPMVYILVALQVLGYPDDHPCVTQAERCLRRLQIVEEDSIRLQPCHSPVWDTGIALCALSERASLLDSAVVQRSVRWLLEKECRTRGDWRMNCDHPYAAGWFFEFDNPHYPDVDDTAMVVMGLTRLRDVIPSALAADAQAAVGRARDWLLAMQNDDGGWAAFDRTRPRPILEQIPFADHNAMQDPSCPDIVGRVIECLGGLGMTMDQASVRRAVAYLNRTQDSDGSWWGRWGVNYVYGTWQVLMGLRAVGVPSDDPMIRRAADWLRKFQQPDGSWGETCGSYDDSSLKGIGPSTPSQTAWGMMGVMAAAGGDDPTVVRAANWLIEHQQTDGTWDEPWFTGTGFPRVFYLKYHLYRLYFPLMALSRYARLRQPKASRKHAVGTQSATF